jgi:hypothetical protein
MRFRTSLSLDTSRESRSERFEESLTRFGVPACILVYVTLSLLTYNDIFEDAYIYFRFAENIAAGYGYVFNRGGPPVEAGTSPVWQFLVAALTFLPIPLVTAVKFLGILFGAVALVLTARLANRFVSDPVARLAPVLLTATSIPFVLWGHRGLETPLFASATLWATLCFTDPTLTRRWGLAASALFLARPEGAFLLLALVPFFWLHRDRPVELARPLLFLLCVAFVVTIARMFYFHDLLPQTFYMKMPSDYGASVAATHFYFRSAFLYPFALPLLLCLPRRSFWSGEKIMLLSVLALLVGWSLMVLEGSKPHFRHLVALLPVFYVACVSGLDYLLCGRTRPLRMLLRIACVAFVIATAAAPLTPARADRLQPNPYGTAMGHFLQDPARYASATVTKIASPWIFTSLDRVAGRPIEQDYQALIGKFLAENYPDGTRIVYDQMGQTAYFAGADKIIVDSYGLTDKFAGYHTFASRAERSSLLRLYRWLFFDIATPAMAWEKRPETAQDALDYLFDFDPDVILINQWLVQNLPGTLTARFSKDERLEQRYVRRAALANLVVLYERKGTERAELQIPGGLYVWEY